MKRFFLLVLISFPFLINAQDAILGSWYIYSGNKIINKNWNWQHDVQYRNYNALGDLEQLLFRTGIGYNLSENNNNILLGYVYTLSENFIKGTNEKEEVNEHRIFQQFVTRQKFNRISIRHRYRFEQRFIGEDIRYRLRYSLSLKIPLNNKELVNKTIYLSGSNEIFLNTREDIFDRERLYSGLGYKLNKAFRFELGYMNQIYTNSKIDQIKIISFINF
jgi:Protein of unknown function (DUF2490)